MSVIATWGAVRSSSGRTISGCGIIKYRKKEYLKVGSLKGSI